jgi:hypothetical protein
MGNVVSFIDLLRKKSPVHAALKAIFDHPPSMPEGSTSSDWADLFMETLWKRGFMIVPRDQKDEVS